MDFEQLLEAFPDSGRKLVEREAKKRGCSAPELLAKQADRYIRDGGYRRKINRLGAKFLKQLIAKRDVTKLVRDPIEGIMITLILTNQAVRIWGFGPTWKEMRKVSNSDHGQN